jgi:pimeloyl-ACP methyl ester carboxylesterase
MSLVHRPRSPGPREQLDAAVRVALAFLLSLPCITGAASLLFSTSFLVEFLSRGSWRPLLAITAEPGVRPLPAVTGGAASSPHPVAVDLYTRPTFRRPPALVLVHGLSPPGKDESRLKEAAALLARSGFAVAVPTVDGLTALRLRPEDRDAVSATVRALRAAGYPRAAVLGISLGAGPALLAASDPATADSLSAVLALGGYASAVELLRYTLTGGYAFAGFTGREAVLEPAIAQFARANVELVDEAGRRLVDNRDPARFDGLVEALPERTRSLLDALSPGRTVAGLRAPLFLIHGREDPAVPFTETLRLEAAARAAGRPVRTAIVGVIGHVDPGRRAGFADLLRLWSVFHAFRRAAER